MTINFYGHFFILVGVAGFEPTTSASRTQHSTRLSYTPITVGGLCNCYKKNAMFFYCGGLYFYCLYVILIFAEQKEKICLQKNF